LLVGVLLTQWLLGRRKWLVQPESAIDMMFVEER
jgi:hypothetical protein